MKLLPTRVAGQGIAPLRSGDPLWWLRDREALVRRFVLSQVLGEPKSRQRRQDPPVGPGSGGPDSGGPGSGGPGSGERR